MIFNVRKKLAECNYIYLNNIKVVQTKRFYSSNNANVSCNVIPVISYFNADSEKNAIIEQNKTRSGI